MTNSNAYEEMLGKGQSNDKLMDHIGLVKRVALHLKTRLPNFMELEELIQVGTIGLIKQQNLLMTPRALNSKYLHEREFEVQFLIK